MEYFHYDVMKLYLTDTLEKGNLVVHSLGDSACTSDEARRDEKSHKNGSCIAEQGRSIDLSVTFNDSRRWEKPHKEHDGEISQDEERERSEYKSARSLKQTH